MEEGIRTPGLSDCRKNIELMQGISHDLSLGLFDLVYSLILLLFQDVKTP